MSHARVPDERERGAGEAQNAEHVRCLRGHMRRKICTSSGGTEESAKRAKDDHSDDQSGDQEGRASATLRRAATAPSGDQAQGQESARDALV